MYMAIEIGGTKLQLAVGDAAGSPLEVLERRDVDPSQGAAGIRNQIAQVGPQLIQDHDVVAVGIGFGGPVDTRQGKIIKSFQIAGWDGFAITEWTEQALQRPAILGNDSDLAGLGEARYGAGRGHRVGGAAEIGHLRPGVHADSQQQTVESISSGWGMTAVAQARLANRLPQDQPSIDDLIARCDGEAKKLNSKILAAAMIDGNALATDIFRQGIQTYGWALAQAITLLDPNVVVIGGGVPLIGETWYLGPLREEVARYVFAPRIGTYEIKLAALGEEVVLYGALALASSISQAVPRES
jgi:glucokinase